MNLPESIGFSFTMSSNAKFLIVVVLSLIAVQTVLSRPDSHVYTPSYVQYDILKHADEYLRDIAEEVLEQEHKVNKDLHKLLIRQGGQLNTCLQEAQSSIYSQMRAEHGVGTTCINNVKSAFQGVQLTNSSYTDLYSIRHQYKDRLKQCKNESKYKVKALRNEFALRANQCALG